MQRADSLNCHRKGRGRVQNQLSNLFPVVVKRSSSMQMKEGFAEVLQSKRVVVMVLTSAQISDVVP